MTSVIEAVQQPITLSATWAVTIVVFYYTRIQEFSPGGSRPDCIFPMTNLAYRIRFGSEFYLLNWSWEICILTHLNTLPILMFYSHSSRVHIHM